MRQICFSFRESDGKFACWIDVPNENAGQSFMSGTTCVPCLDYRGNFVEPWHRDGRTGFEHNDCARIRCGNLLDHRILMVRKRQTRQVHIFRRPLVCKDDCEIRTPGETYSGLQVSSRIVFDFRIRQLRTESFQRRRRKPDVILPVCFTRARRHDGIPAWRVHLRRSPTGKHSDISMSSDDRNAVDRLDNWQYGTSILQEYDTLLFDSLRYFETFLDIDHALPRRVVNHTGEKLRIQDPPCVVVNLRHGTSASTPRFFQLRPEVVGHRLFLIETAG